MQLVFIFAVWEINCALTNALTQSFPFPDFLDRERSRLGRGLRKFRTETFLFLGTDMVQPQTCHPKFREEVDVWSLSRARVSTHIMS